MSTARIRAKLAVPLNRATLARQLLLDRWTWNHWLRSSISPATTRRLVDEQPLIASELGRRLAEHFPGHDPEALAQGACAWLPMVQVPPRGVWGRSGRSLQAPLESWLGQAVSPMPVDRLVTRYLTAFGPATIRDTQTWCGLTKLAEIVEAIRPELVTFTDEDGRELFGVPHGPRPDGDTPRRRCASSTTTTTCCSPMLIAAASCSTWTTQHTAIPLTRIGNRRRCWSTGSWRGHRP